MKKIIIIVALCFVSKFTFAQNEYFNSMSESIEQLESVDNIDDLLSVANNFERIAHAIDQEWLPNYYHSFTSLLIATKFLKSAEMAKFENYIKQAESSLEKASEKTTNSEILVMKAYILQMKMASSPMANGPLYHNTFMKTIKTAIEMDETNPRPHLLLGEQFLNMPAFWGGSIEKAAEQFRLAVEKFEHKKGACKEEESSAIQPRWGEKFAKNSLEKTTG